MKKLLLSLFLLSIGCIFTSSKSHSPKWVTELHGYYNDDPTQFVNYWYDSQAMKNYECVHGIDQELIITKMWNETHGGHRGAGRWGCLFGIKGEGVKGYDEKESKFQSKGKVEYRGYNSAWESISDFCKLVKKPLYANRFEAWKQINFDMPDWYNYSLALQVHPDINQSRLAYASCGCEADRKTGKINWACYEKRKAHAMKNINWVLNNLRK